MYQSVISHTVTLNSKLIRYVTTYNATCFRTAATIAWFINEKASPHMTSFYYKYCQERYFSVTDILGIWFIIIGNTNYRSRLLLNHQNLHKFTFINTDFVLTNRKYLQCSKIILTTILTLLCNRILHYASIHKIKQVWENVT